LKKAGFVVGERNFVKELLEVHFVLDLLHWNIGKYNKCSLYYLPGVQGTFNLVYFPLGFISPSRSPYSQLFRQPSGSRGAVISNFTSRSIANFTATVV